MSTPADERDRPRARYFVPVLVVGWALMGVGVIGALGNSDDANPAALVRFVVGFDLFHDLVFAPLLFLGAWLIARLAPAPARGPIRAAGALTVLIVLFSRPLVAGYGRRPGNSSTLPLDYGRTVLVLLAAVWAAAALVIAMRVRRRRAGATTTADDVPTPS